MPFLIVAPLVVTKGGANVRGVPSYHYCDAVWSEIERVGPIRFDAEGIAAVVADVKRLYVGEDRYFLTGWEAGGHTVWAMLFQYPEQWRAVAPGFHQPPGAMDDAREVPARAR
jgi:dienelactone hydrolase